MYCLVKAIPIMRNRQAMLTIRMGQKHQASPAPRKALKIRKAVRIGFRIRMVQARDGRIRKETFGAQLGQVVLRTADPTGTFRLPEVAMSMCIPEAGADE